MKVRIIEGHEQKTCLRLHLHTRTLYKDAAFCELMRKFALKVDGMATILFAKSARVNCLSVLDVTLVDCEQSTQARDRQSERDRGSKCDVCCQQRHAGKFSLSLDSTPYRISAVVSCSFSR